MNVQAAQGPSSATGGPTQPLFQFHVPLASAGQHVPQAQYPPQQLLQQMQQVQQHHVAQPQQLLHAQQQQQLEQHQQQYHSSSQQQQQPPPQQPPPQPLQPSIGSVPLGLQQQLAAAMQPQPGG